MKCKHIGPNAVEIEAGEVSILFSYATPVAAHVAGRGYFRTAERHSVITSRHINGWLGGAKALDVPQSMLDALGLVCEGGRETTGTARWEFGPGRITGTLDVRMGGKNMTFYERITATRLGACATDDR